MILCLINFVKNSTLAFFAFRMLHTHSELIQLKNRNRIEIYLLLNAYNILFLILNIKGLPQIIKETMTCNCPIVTTDFGDISH